MVEERIEPIAPEIKFNLTNSVKSIEKDFIFHSGTKNEEKLSTLKNYAQRYTLLYGYAVNKVTNDTEWIQLLKHFLTDRFTKIIMKKRKLKVLCLN